MKKFIKLSSFLVVLAIVLSLFTFSANAASSTTLYFSKNKIDVGEKVTVSVAISPNEAMYAVKFYLQYDESVLKFESGNGTQGSAGVLNVVESPEGDKKVRYSFTFSGIKAGSSAISVIDCAYATHSSGATTEKKFTGASATLTVKDDNLSDNANLKSLIINGYSISPSFSSSNTAYTAKVPYDVKKISVTAVTSDKNAKVKSVQGADKLKVGKNTVTVTVEAQNGTQKQYIITVTRADEDDNTSSEEVIAQISDLETIVEGRTYVIVTELPDNLIFKGFTKEKTVINGFEIDSIIDKEGIYRIFYLQAKDNETNEILPFIYNAELDCFEPLKYVNIGDNTYIFDNIPADLEYPESLYPSTVQINDFSVECLAETTGELEYFKYVYCYFDGNYNLYRYDTDEKTLQRYPDFALTAATEAEENDNIFTRFGSLSSNGKVIMIALLIVVLGIFALLVLLIVYLIRRSVNRGYELDSYDDDDFDQVEIKNNTDNN